MSQYVVDGPIEMVGYEQLTVSNSAIGFTEAKYFKTGKVANCAVVRTSHDIRYTLDNTNTDLVLSASVGMPWTSANGDLIISLEDLSKVRFIRATASDATLDCRFDIR